MSPVTTLSISLVIPTKLIEQTKQNCFEGAGTTPIPINWGNLRPRRIWTARIQKHCKSVEKRNLRPWFEFPPPAKLRPWSELIAKMAMGVVPGLVTAGNIFGGGVIIQAQPLFSQGVSILQDFRRPAQRCWAWTSAQITFGCPSISIPKPLFLGLLFLHSWSNSWQHNRPGKTWQRKNAALLSSILRWIWAIPSRPVASCLLYSEALSAQTTPDLLMAFVAQWFASATSVDAREPIRTNLFAENSSIFVSRIIRADWARVQEERDANRFTQICLTFARIAEMISTNSATKVMARRKFWRTERERESQSSGFLPPAAPLWGWLVPRSCPECCSTDQIANYPREQVTC